MKSFFQTIFLNVNISVTIRLAILRFSKAKMCQNCYIIYLHNPILHKTSHCQNEFSSLFLCICNIVGVWGYDPVKKNLGVENIRFYGHKVRNFNC